ncbi:hypothetical protein GCM10023322_10280 [Rugosimonospora acidiphila]|uniref:Uncharacterized protein n=1 Tax=Rugosimonospora acidiphila TaxID=556531 RepID=A0ABP9RMD5_9ACTN
MTPRRFTPLGRVLCVDEFHTGLDGWCALIGNHRGDTTQVQDRMADLRPPHLSTLPFFDIGSHGSGFGGYAMKLMTRPRAGSCAMAIKRLTSVADTTIRFECYLAYKSDPAASTPAGADDEWDGNADPGEAAFGEFVLSNDIVSLERGTRAHCAIRYANTHHDGSLVQRWEYKTSLQPTTKMVRAGLAPENGPFHTVHGDDWRPLPGGAEQRLCYNETATKVNWHYLGWTFSSRTMRNVSLQVNDRIWDLSEVAVPTYPDSYTGLRGLLNFLVDVRTTTNSRNTLYLDSCCISADW